MIIAHHLHDVGRMAAARALGVKGMDRAALDGGKRILHKAAFIERVGVDHHLHVHVVCDTQAAINRAGRGAPILVQFHSTGPRADHLDQCFGLARVALGREAEIHRKAVQRLQHSPDMPRSRRAGGGERAMRGPSAATQHGGDAGMERILDLLRTDEVDMRVEPAGGENAALSGDDLGSRSDDDIDARLRIGIARLADGGNEAVAQTDIGLGDPLMIDDQRIGDDGVHGPARTRGLALPHAVADHLAAAELHLFAIGGQIALYLDNEVGIAKAQPVAGGGAIHGGIGGAGDRMGHSEISHHLLVKAEHPPRTAIGDEPHLAALARLEPHGGAGGNI